MCIAFFNSCLVNSFFFYVSTTHVTYFPSNVLYCFMIFGFLFFLLFIYNLHPTLFNILFYFYTWIFFVSLMASVWTPRISVLFSVPVQLSCTNKTLKFIANIHNQIVSWQKNRQMLTDRQIIVQICF